MNIIHNCVEEFETRKIDDCSGKAYNRCYGTNPMHLEIWYQDTDGTECYFDNWTETKVNFCPFCGLKAEETK